MADVTVPQIASGFRPVSLDIKPQNQTSIGDIVNMAATMQAYQKQKELMPYQIEAGKAQSQEAQIGAQKAAIDLQQHNANISRGVLGGLLTDPDFINGNSEGMVKKLQKSREFLRSIGVESPDGGERMNQLMIDAKNDPKAVYQEIKNGVQQAGGGAAQYQTMQATQPTQIYQGNQPPAQGGYAGTQGGQQAPAANMELPYPVRQPGMPYAPGISEPQDLAAGQEYRKAIRTQAESLPVSRRNVQEVQDVVKQIQSAGVPTTGKAGEFTRWLNANVGSDLGVQYRQLSKDLANTQITQLQAEGKSLETDAGKALIAHANGDETYPPDVLMNISRRTAAQIANTDMKSNAAEKFANRFGDNNMKAFQKAWQNNSDSKIFELISLQQSGLPKEEMQAEITKLLGTNPERRKDYFQKYNNIMKLYNTGSL